MSCGVLKCGFGSNKKFNEPEELKIRKKSKSHKKSKGHKKSKVHPKQKGHKKHHYKKHVRKFGSEDMGNAPNQMSIFQGYTGMPPAQMQDHMDNIPMNLRSNFYTNLYGRKKSRRFGGGIFKQNVFGRSNSGLGSKLSSTRFSSRFGPKRRFSRRFGPSRRFSRRFGKMNPGLSHIMGNSVGQDMSTFQGYTGLAPMQMENHVADTPMSIRSNFYTEL